MEKGKFTPVIEAIEYAINSGKSWRQIVRTGAYVSNQCVGVGQNKKVEEPAECPYKLEPLHSPLGNKQDPLQVG